MQFLLLCNPPKSGASWICITFPQITQNILAKDIFQWLEVITKTLSFLQMFNVTKSNHSVYNIFLKTSNKINRKLYFWKILGLSKQNADNSHDGALFPSDSNNSFFICLVPYILIGHYYFLIFSFYFHLFSYSSFHGRHSAILNVLFDFITICP